MKDYLNVEVVTSDKYLAYRDRTAHHTTVHTGLYTAVRLVKTRETGLMLMYTWKRYRG